MKARRTLVDPSSIMTIHEYVPPIKEEIRESVIVKDEYISSAFIHSQPQNHSHHQHSDSYSLGKDNNEIEGMPYFISQNFELCK